MLAHLRHELRTPLNHIIGYSELLLEEAAESGGRELAPGLNRVHENARQLLGLINNFLAPGGAEAAGVDLASARGELTPPLNRIIAAGEALSRQVDELGATQLRPDIERVLSAAGKLQALIREGPAETPAGGARAAAGENALHSTESGAILVVDDNEGNRDMLARRLMREGYRVEVAAGGHEALKTLETTVVDLVLLDIMMPEMDGYQVLEKLKANDASREIPVIVLSALDEIESVVKCIDMGAEDYLPKPFNPVLLRSRIGACLEKKRLRDLEVQHARELAEWNKTLEDRVQEQVTQLDRLGRLKRFFSPQLAALIISGDAKDPLKTHRCELTVVFVDLRGFTAFAETAEPEEVMGVLHDYHAAMGKLILEYEGTLEHFAGDGMMIFFNDPVPVPDPAERAIRMTVAMRERVKELTVKWHKLSYDLDFGVGIVKGYATIGAIGFEGRWEYGAIGSVPNLAARLCGEAKPGQILIPQRLLASVEEMIEAEPVGELSLKGFHRTITAYNVLRLKG